MAIMIVMLVIGTSYYYFFLHENKTKLVVFHAGSLTLPFDYLEKDFEENNSDIDVQMEKGGSAKLVRSIIDLNKKCDVLAVADYSLIEKNMFQDYASWYIQFAKNRMVIAYNEESNINETNWYQTLRNQGFGFANPNKDPCGYRALMVIQLAEIYYNDSRIFDDLIVKNTDITVSEDNGTYNIRSAEDINPEGNVVVADKSVDLIYKLQTGDLKYAFEYMSVAKQHNLHYLLLPDEIDLSNTTYKETYSRVVVHRFPDGNSTGKPIVYGITIPENAEHKDMAIKFVKFLLEEYKNGDMNKFGQPAIVPAKTNNINVLPDELKEYCSE
jgi:molybdate/tungstate transport system substrate-binding protein